MDEKREVTINVTKEQLEVINGIFIHHGWDLEILKNNWEENTSIQVETSDVSDHSDTESVRDRVLTSFRLPLVNTLSDDGDDVIPHVNTGERDLSVNNEASEIF